LFAVTPNGGRKAWKAVTTIPAWQNEVRDDVNDDDGGDDAADGDDDDNGDKNSYNSSSYVTISTEYWQHRNWDTDWGNSWRILFCYLLRFLDISASLEQIRLI
jgi:hypothetical protein